MSPSSEYEIMREAIQCNIEATRVLLKDAGELTICISINVKVRFVWAAPTRFMLAAAG